MCPQTWGSLLNVLFISRKKLKIHSIATKGKINPVHTSEGIWGSGHVASLILNLGYSWRWVVNFMPLLPQLCERTPWSPLNRRLGGPQSRCGCWDKRQISFPCWDSNHGSSSMYPRHYPVLSPEIWSAFWKKYFGMTAFYCLGQISAVRNIWPGKGGWNY
jgi:hypothetical protein